MRSSVLGHDAEPLMHSALVWSGAARMTPGALAAGEPGAEHAAGPAHRASPPARA